MVKNLGEKSLTYKKALQKVITVTSYTNLDGFSLANRWMIRQDLQTPPLPRLTFPLAIINHALHTETVL